MENSIETFLSNPNFSVMREKMFFHKLYYDLKFASAKRNTPLYLYEPDVDREGFDVLFYNVEYDRKIQLKTVLTSSRTDRWVTTKKFFLPTDNYVNNLLEPHILDPCNNGMGGGIILIEIDLKNNCDVCYYYSDFFVLLAFANWLIFRSKDQVNKAYEIIQKLKYDKSNIKLTIPKKLFLKIKSPDELLGICGFHNINHIMFWEHNFLRALQGIPKDNIYKAKEERKEIYLNRFFYNPGKDLKRLEYYLNALKGESENIMLEELKQAIKEDLTWIDIDLDGNLRRETTLDVFRDFEYSAKQLIQLTNDDIEPIQYNKEKDFLFWGNNNISPCNGKILVAKF